MDGALGVPAARAWAAGEVLTVFAADHGESLGEHGEGTHGFFVYDSTVLVPLFVRFPGRVAPGSSACPRGSWTSRRRSSTCWACRPRRASTA